MDEQKKIISEFAIASLVIGIVSFISLAGIEKAILAIVFGALALKRIEKEGGVSGGKLAKVGIALGIASVIFTVVFIIKFFPKIQEQMKQIQSKDSVIEGEQGLGSSQELEGAPETKLY